MKEGYRGWRLRQAQDGHHRLFSPTFGNFYWESGLNIAEDGVSIHINEREPAKPTESNHCGFYALKSPENVWEYFGGRIDVIGKVFLYGQVIEGVEGYRGEKAQVGSILLPTVSYYPVNVLDELVKYYRIPLVVTGGSLRRLLEYLRNKNVKQRMPRARRCTAGGRAIASIRKDGFLL